MTNTLITKAYNDVKTAIENRKAAEEAEQQALRVLKETCVEETGKNYAETEDGWVESRVRPNKKTGEENFFLVNHGEKKPFQRVKQSREDKTAKAVADAKAALLADLRAKGVDSSIIDSLNAADSTSDDVVLQSTGTDDEIVIDL